MPIKTERRSGARTDRRTRAARAEATDTREALLDAAAHVFATRGFRDASIDEIARQAGYSKGAVYWHFETKDDLFLALLEARVDAPLREMVALLESAGPEQDMAPEGSRRFAELLTREPQLLLLEHEYWTLATRDSALRRRYSARRTRLRRALARALTIRLERLGTPVDLDPEATATVILSLAAGLAQQKLIQPDSVPDDLLGETVALIYRGAVARSASG